MFWVPMYQVKRIRTIHYSRCQPVDRVLPDQNFAGGIYTKTSIELEREINRREFAELKLAEANKSLEAFASIASMIYRNPCEKIKTFSSLLYETNSEKFSPESIELANKIIHSTERMQTLINDVLSLSTISEEIEFEPVQIGDVISTVKEDLEIKLLEKHAVIQFGEIPLVKGNKSYLTQLFFYLFSNGIKFNHQNPVITITGEIIGSRVLIKVSDNGIGIEESDLAKIFEAFSRLNAKSEFDGSGIGLAICKKIVTIHNGDIHVTSKPGQGSTFIFDLPAYKSNLLRLNA